MQGRILLIIGSAAIGGAEKQIVNLAINLNKKSFSSKLLFLTGGGPLENVLLNNKIEYKIANFKKHSPFHNMIISIKLIIKYFNQGFTIFYVFLPQAILFFGTLSRLTNRKLVIIYGVRGSIFIKNSLLYRLYRRELSNADLIICNSQFLQDEVATLKNIDRSKIQVIKNGIDLNTKKLKRIERESDIHKVLVVANFKLYKGHDLLLKAVQLIDNTILHITFVGSGEELERIKIESAKINKHLFTFVGELTQIQDLYAEYDFVLHPSKSESLSNAIIEALNAGLPVVCFNVGGNKELIENANNGYLVSPFDIEEFAAAIKAVISNDQHLNELSRNAAKKAKEFSWERNIELHIQAFNRAQSIKLNNDQYL